MMLVPALAVLSACGDDITDLDGLMDSAEAEAVMRSAEELPLLPGFIESTHAVDGQRAMLFRARELWDQGATSTEAEGSARRRLAVGYAAPVLVESVPAEEWGEARDRIEEWMNTASDMLRHLSIPEVATQLEAARRQLRRSDQARTERTRVYHLLLAGSELVETTPRFVARSMTRDAESVVARAVDRSDPAVPAATLERAKRLKDWAARAVEDGDHLLAIQRAYYAIQLLEER